MFRAIRPRGEDDPTVLKESAAGPASVESLLALSLCTTVILASVAFLRRSSDLSRALAGLQGDSSRATPERIHSRAVPGAEQGPELVIVVALDGLRADRLALEGYERDTAPRLCELGTESVVFHTVAAQSSQALVSHKSILTGKYPATLMLEETGADLHQLSRLRDGRAYLVRTFSAVQGTLAAAFGARGFRTAAFTSGSWTDRAAGFAHGFEVFDDAGGGLADLVPRALAWLEHSAARPSFLYLQADDLRCPYDAPEPFGRAFCRGHAAHGRLGDRCDPVAPQRVLSEADCAALSDHYDGCLLGVDAQLGAFLDGLRARGLYDRALIVVTSAHGESLGERGRVGHGGLHLEELLVPLILKFPRSWNLRPAVVAEPAETIDLLPTLWAACRIPGEKEIDGVSLLPTVLRGVRGRDTLVAQTSFEQGSERVSSPVERTLLRPGRWQMIHDVARSEASFFALQDDPRGLTPLAIRPQEFEPLLEILLERRRPDAHGALRSDPPPAFGAALASELEELGYGSAALAGSGTTSALR